MTVLRNAVAVGTCLLILSCGSSEPSSPLILDGDPLDVAAGPRTLTAAQTRELRDVIESAGEPCQEVSQTFLRAADIAGRTESWDVRCGEAAYAVRIMSDATPSDVRRCVPSFNDAPCWETYAARGGPRRPARGELNPDLEKLLAPMTAPDGKTDNSTPKAKGPTSTDRPTR